MAQIRYGSQAWTFLDQVGARGLVAQLLAQGSIEQVPTSGAAVTELVLHPAGSPAPVPLSSAPLSFKAGKPPLPPPHQA
jgi:hypothetical protein